MVCALQSSHWVQELCQQKVEKGAPATHWQPPYSIQCLFHLRQLKGRYSPQPISTVHTLSSSYSVSLWLYHNHIQLGFLLLLFFCNLHIIVSLICFLRLPPLSIFCLPPLPSSRQWHCGNWRPEQAANSEASHRKTADRSLFSPPQRRWQEPGHSVCPLRMEKKKIRSCALPPSCKPCARTSSCHRGEDTVWRSKAPRSHPREITSTWTGNK